MYVYILILHFHESSAYLQTRVKLREQSFWSLILDVENNTRLANGNLQ